MLRRGPIPSAAARGSAHRRRPALQVDQHRQGLAPALVRHPRRRPRLFQDPTPLQPRPALRRQAHWPRPNPMRPPPGPHSWRRASQDLLIP
uniref:Uncharacterized protein n=1 Tax=Arundo donax TaxID=35708 RepID=A0A0A9CPN5_ARUDO